MRDYGISDGSVEAIRGVINRYSVQWNREGVRICMSNVRRYSVEAIAGQRSLFGANVRLTCVECQCGAHVMNFHAGINECPECSNWLVTIDENNFR